MFASLTSKVVTAICAVVGAIALLGTFFLTVNLLCDVHSRVLLVDGVRAGTRSVRVLRAWRDGRPASHDSSRVSSTILCGADRCLVRSINSIDPPREARKLCTRVEALSLLLRGSGPG
jgi:hypothetical protein